MIEFKRNKETGIVEAYKDGVKVGDIKTMGDDLQKNKEVNNGDRSKTNKP